MIFSYLIYGLSFFLLWIVLIFYNANLSRYSFMRKLWLIALFAITHGLHDWIRVFMILEKLESVYLEAFSLGLMVISFYFLIQFSVSSGIFVGRLRLLNTAPLALLLLWCAATAASGHKLVAGDVFGRYFLGFPGAVMTAYALFVRRGEEKELAPALNRNMTVAGWSFAGYAVFSGLVVPPADFPPASALNYATFAHVVGVPVHLFRAICIMAMTYALAEVFQIFEANLRASLKRANEALEVKVRERTAELTSSNERYETELLERRQTEAALRESEQRYRQLFENMQEGFLIQTVLEDAAGRPVDARYLDVNPASERFLGKRRAEIVGKTRNEVLGVPDPEIIAALDRVAKSGKPFHLVRHSAGAGKWFESFSYSLEAGQVATLVVDITERKLAEEKIQQSEAKYRNLFESSTDGIFIIGLDGNFIDVNRTACARLGYTKEEMLAMHIGALDQPEFAARAPERMRQILDHGIAVFESAHLRKDGTAMPVEVNSRLMEYEGRTVFFSVIRDITERKQAEKALREKTRLLEDLTRDLEERVADEIAVRIKNERMMVQQSKLAAMGEMLGAIAHQWRQPLNVVGLIVQRMEDAHARGKLDADEMGQMAEKAMKQIERMSRTIDDFRNFFKPDKEKTSFDAMRAVGDVLSLVSAQLTADNIAYKLTCRVHGKTFENEVDVAFCAEKNIEGFRNEFEHVILNLVNNARDAIAERRARGGMGASDKGLLSFDFSCAGNRITIKMSDNGGGIRPEAMKSIFSPYFTTKDPTKGTGLGLYMSKVIVEEHMQGTLSAENAGEGALFTIELPQGGTGIRHGFAEAV